MCGRRRSDVSAAASDVLTLGPAMSSDLAMFLPNNIAEDGRRRTARALLSADRSSVALRAPAWSALPVSQPLARTRATDLGSGALERG